MADHLETRVAELSATVAGLGEADRKHEKGLAALTEQVTTGFRELREAISKTQATPWITILMLLSFLLSLTMFVGFLARQPLADATVDNRALILREADKREALQGRVDYMRGQFDTLLGRKP